MRQHFARSRIHNPSKTLKGKKGVALPSGGGYPDAVRTDLHRVFNLVKEQTGYPVSVSPLAEQSTHARMVSATKATPAHVIFVNPRFERFGNYLVAAQCAALLIKWRNPQQVSDFVVAREKAAVLGNKIEGAMLKKGLDRASVGRYAEAVVNGLFQQLNSTPLEILSIDWCFKECPELRDEQELYVTAHLRELSASLDPKIRALAPPDVFERNASMNAAYALNWAETSDSKAGMLPYEALGFTKKGQDLLSELREIPTTSPDVYTRAVDSWAKRLKMIGWYRWEPKNL